MKTAILLGAGSSLPAGYPSTNAITNLVLTGVGITRATDSSYYIEDNTEDVQDGTTVLANKMAKKLYSEMNTHNEYYGLDQIPNYEDIAYLATQGCEQWSGEIDNPIILEFINRLRIEMASEICELKDHSHKTCFDNAGKDDMLASLFEETRNYIADIVWRCLLRSPRSLNHLNMIKYIFENSELTSLSTLCHDYHLETFLREEGIALADGFSESAEGGIRFWNNNLFSDEKTPYLKLHGSIDWFELTPRSGDIYDYSVGLLAQHLDCMRLKTSTGDRLNSRGRPLLLIGTFNKISEYSSGIFRDLHCCFRSTVRKADLLVVCGYSFGDKGINSEIADWICGDRKRHLTVIHPDKQNLLSHARPAIRDNWSEWEKHGSVSVIEKYLECVDDSDLPLHN